MPRGGQPRNLRRLPGGRASERRGDARGARRRRRNRERQRRTGKGGGQCRRAKNGPEPAATNGGRPRHGPLGGLTMAADRSDAVLAGVADAVWRRARNEACPLEMIPDEAALAAWWKDCPEDCSGRSKPSVGAGPVRGFEMGADRGRFAAARLQTGDAAAGAVARRGERGGLGLPTGPRRPCVVGADCGEGAAETSAGADRGRLAGALEEGETVPTRAAGKPAGTAPAVAGRRRPGCA